MERISQVRGSRWNYTGGRRMRSKREIEIAQILIKMSRMEISTSKGVEQIRKLAEEEWGE
jgi:hypothetical protein